MLSFLKIIFILLLTLLPFLSSPNVLADVIQPDGEGRGHSGGNRIHLVNYCFQISNVEQFQNYLFLVDKESEDLQIKDKGDIHGQILKSDSCIRVNNYEPAPVIYALARNKANRPEIKINNSDQSIRISRAGKSQLIPSNLKLHSSDWSSEEILEIRDVLNIVAVKNNLELKFQKVVYSYGDVSEEQIYQVQGERPKPSRVIPTRDSRNQHILLSILGIPTFIATFALVAMFALRKFNFL